MTDAVSTIALGVDTGTGFAELKALRAEFQGLKADIVALSGLTASTQGLTGNVGSAKNELATLSAELKAAGGRINELEQQLARLGRRQADTAKANTEVVKTETKAAFDVQLTSAKNLANEIAQIEAKTTAKIKDEAAKRYAVTQSAKVGDLNYSVKSAGNESSFMAAVTEAQRVRREIAANAQAMLMAEADRAAQSRRTGQEMQKAELDRQAEARRTSIVMQKAELDRAAEARRTGQEMQRAEYERVAQSRRTGQEMLRAELDRRAEARRTGQDMQKAELDRQAESRRTGREMLRAELDRAAEARRVSQEMLRAELERQAEIRRTAQAMLIAEQDRRKEARQTANEMLRAELERNAARRSSILDNNFATGSDASRVTTVRRAAGLVNSGEAALARELYGPAAVAAVGNLRQMEEALLATRGKGNSAARELADRQRVINEAMREGHSAARGLAGGLGQLWVTYGSILPLLAGAAVTGSIAKIYSAGQEVEYQLQFLRALADDLEKRPIDLDGFLRITDGTMASVKDAAGGMRSLAQAGMDQEQALRALPNVLDLAAIGELSVANAALTATGVVHAFNLELSDIGRVGDVFAKIAASSNTSVQAMTESMKSASTVGEMFKVEMEEAAASIGVLAQRNITGTSAGTALTTALKNLYEPTAKAKKALEEMNITTEDGNGGLKNYTQLLEELRQKLSGLNDSSKAVFLGTITDQRGAKAVSAITSNMKDYKKFLDDAKQSTGFMSKATLELEDTVQGASRRISNSLEGSFIKAFKEASPSIREVMTELNGLAKSENLVSILSRLAITAAGLTKTLMDNATAIGVAVAGYLSLKMISTLAAGYVSLRTAITAMTAATAANTVATTANAAALTFQERAALLASRGMMAAGTAARFLSASFGPISLVVLAAVTAYELFHSRISESDNAMKAANNTADTVLEYYERQIAKLRELNQELLNNSKASGKAANDTAKAVLQAQLLAKDQEIDQMVKSGGGKNPVSYADKALVGDQAQTELQKARADRKRLADKILTLENQSMEEESLRGLNKKLNSKKSVEQRLETLIRDAGGDELDPAGNDATKAMLPKLRALETELKSNSNAYVDVAKKIVEYRAELNSKLGTFVPPHHDKAQNDAYRAAQSAFDGRIQAVRDDEKSKLSEIKTKLDTSEIGNLQAIAQRLQVVKAAREEELGLLRQKAALAKGEDKKAAEQQIVNKIASNMREGIEADRDADRERRELFNRWNQDSLKSEAENLRKRGQLRLAFEKEFDAKNGNEIASLDKDLAQSPANIDFTEWDRANSRKQFLGKERDTGAKLATFDELQDKYDRLMDNMQERIADVAQKASESNGFMSDVGAARAADDIRNSLTPAIQDTIRDMGQIAEALDDNSLRASVSRMSTTLIKESDRSRAAWVAAGKSISAALSEAFGKGGKAAGGVVDALIKQRAAQKDIENDLDKAKTENPAKMLEAENAAREKSAQLQISTYGQIAGAAKGFFDEQSKGYAALQAAEKVFRAFELAEAIRVHFIKSGFLTSFTSLFAAQKATETTIEAGTVATTVAAEGAKQTAHGTTGLAAALSLPFPANIPAFAAVAAMLAAIGVAVKGGKSSMSVSAQRQKEQGTGSVFGDDTAKSESISKSLEHLSRNADLGLKYSASMTSSLQNIESSLSGLGGLLLRNDSVTGKLAPTDQGSAYRFGSSTAGVAITGGFIGLALDKLTGGWLGKATGKVANAIFGGKTTAEDTGFTLNKGTIASLIRDGVSASQYSDMKKDGGWFSSDKRYTDLTSLGSEANEQFGKVLQNMARGVAAAGEALGFAGPDFIKKMDSFVVDIGKVSLKGLKGEEIQKALESVFSKLGDDMAKYALPGLNDFQKVGEGYFETLVRVASGVDVADYALERLGVTAVKYTDVLNKQGDVAAEIVRDSLVMKEASSGVGQIIKSMAGSVGDITQAYTELNEVRNIMRATGTSKADVTTSMIRGAGGLENLSSGMNDFLENFFTDGERAAAKATMLQEEFAKLGITMPKSIIDFKNIAQSIDRTTEAGQTLYGAMIGLSGKFADMADDAGTVNPALAKQRASVETLVETAERWMAAARDGRSLLSDIDKELAKNGGKTDNTQRIQELRDMMSSGTVSFEQQLELAGEIKDLVLERFEIEKENAEKLIEFGRELREYVKDLRTGDKSPLTNSEKLAEAQKQYNQTLLDLNSSDESTRDKARDSLQGRADTLLDLAKTYYASSKGYTDIFNSVVEQLDAVGLGSVAKGSATETAAQDQLKELKELRVGVSDIVKAVETEFQTASKQLATQLRIMDEMSNKLGVISEVPAILRSLPAELAGQMARLGAVNGTGVNGTSADGIKDLYRTLLKREGNAEEVGFWVNAMKTHGASMETIKDAFLNSPEYKKLNGSHANGLDRVPFDGYVAELHEGESVLTATEARAYRTNKAAMASTSSFSSEERDQMAQEIAELKRSVDRLVEASGENTDKMVRAMYGSSAQAAETVAEATKEAVTSNNFNEKNRPAYS